MNLAQAEKLAQEIVQAISPYCHRVAIAGSVRRKVVMDHTKLELVAVPRNDKLVELRNTVNLLGTPRVAFPAKHTKTQAASTMIEIHWVNADQFGVSLFEFTGPTDYVIRGKAFWHRLNGGRVANHKLYLADDTVVPTPLEEDVYKAFKIPFKNPENRK